MDDSVSTPLITSVPTTNTQSLSRGPMIPSKDVSRDIVGKNNQNTMLLDRLFKAHRGHNIIAIQGESRVFLFDCCSNNSMDDNCDVSNDELHDKREQCRNLLLKLYVSPLVRVLKIASTFFNLIDNATFACIILMFFGAKVLHSKEAMDNIFDGHFKLNMALVVTMSSDVLHNIMHSSTRLWNLNRIDLPLVLVLYLAYYSIVLTAFFQSTKRDWTYLYVLSFRFVAFYLTTSCEYWVDTLVLTILRKLKRGVDFNFPLLGFPYTRLNKDDREALDTYKGTYCSWNWRESTSRFLKDISHHNGTSRRSPTLCSHCCFYVGGIVAFVVVFLLTCVVVLLVSIPYVILHVLTICCRRCCGWGIHDEIWLF